MKKNRRNFDKKPREFDDRGAEKENKGGAVICGVSPVLESLRAEKRRIDKLFIAENSNEHRISEILELARQKGIQFQRSPREKLNSLVEPGANHQGVVAIAASARYFDADQLIADLSSDPSALGLILDGVEDPRNLGAILRVAECAGVNSVFIPERRAVGLTETVAKSSAGAIEHVRVAKAANVNRLIDLLKKENIWIIGAAGEADADYTEWDWTQPSVLVMGGEGGGLHRLTAEKCDSLVKIPMKGKIESLNVSVAAGVILFEALRQRNLK
ncbi:MAG: 23S rRNA (guanosine(2251)-2'-O)-methyltransferase RlmB [Pyrinomonadaceae bacterium]|nr:23S rRNA (guanosine(2251)-2'-O)-methyltransferase RlmB [Pyrinomonadaceae bacterium]